MSIKIMSIKVYVKYYIMSIKIGIENSDFNCVNEGN